jgi:hypothetical protein
MFNMKYTIILILTILLSACNNPGEVAGDGRESGSDKREWSILQGLEYESRNQIGLKFEIIREGNYDIVVLPKQNKKGAILIMLNPKAPPFYKQMPNIPFNLSKEEYSKIIEHESTISTVEEALESHIQENPLKALPATTPKNN